MLRAYIRHSSTTEGRLQLHGYAGPTAETTHPRSSGQLLPEQEANATAYYCSYILDSHIDLHALTQWPTDAELVQASDRAFDNAEQLLSATGINAASALTLYEHPSYISRDIHAHVEVTNGPSTLAEILTLYDFSSASIPVRRRDLEEIEACHMALIPEGMDKTLKMYVYSYGLFITSASQNP